MNPIVFPKDNHSVSTDSYDIAIGTIGYESRASAIFKQNIHFKQGYSLIFKDNRCLAFDANSAFFSNLGFEVKEATQDGISALCAEIEYLIQAKAHTTTPLTIFFDISAITRNLLANTLYNIRSLALANKINIDVTIGYSLAEFGNLPPDFGPIVFNGPAIPELCGWPKDQTQDLGLILGIGYEKDLAMGVIEELEPAGLWMFKPRNLDPKYDDAIKVTNRGLFDTGLSGNMGLYPIEDAYATFVMIDSAISRCIEQYRTIILPLGPKMFAAAACLSALRHFPHVGFWRVSGGKNVVPVDRKSNGQFLFLEAKFSANQ